MSGLQTCRDTHRFTVNVYTHLSKKEGRKGGESQYVRRISG